MGNHLSSHRQVVKPLALPLCSLSKTSNVSANLTIVTKAGDTGSNPVESTINLIVDLSKVTIKP